MTNQGEKYTVWVGGTEVTSTRVPKEQAEFIANEFVLNGYDDVLVEQVGKRSARRYCETMKHIRKIMADLKYKTEQDND
jgi:hypothetical protein